MQFNVNSHIIVIIQPIRLQHTNDPHATSLGTTLSRLMLLNVIVEGTGSKFLYRKIQVKTVYVCLNNVGPQYFTVCQK